MRVGLPGVSLVCGLSCAGAGEVCCGEVVVPGVKFRELFPTAQDADFPESVSESVLVPVGMQRHTLARAVKGTDCV